MKRLSTNLLKNPAVAILTALFLSSVFSASAEEYKSMIRYDRVWEHYSIFWNDKNVFYVKFDGTEEINGKVYHRLAAFRKAGFDYNTDGSAYLFDVDENYYEHEGYMREEDGKVYTLVVNVDSEQGNYSYDEPLMWKPSETDLPNIIEKPIYDFTHQAGDTYNGLLSEIGNAFEMPYKVTSIETVEIDGQEHRLQRICVQDYEGDWSDYWTQPIIEGVGIGSYGCLTTVNFMMLRNCPCNGHIFNRMLSMDGKVLYRAEDNCIDIPVGSLSGVDGITWQPNEDGIIYDVLGRRIAKPAPGQIYIQGGRKHIAR